MSADSGPELAAADYADGLREQAAGFDRLENILAALPSSADYETLRRDARSDYVSVDIRIRVNLPVEPVDLPSSDPDDIADSAEGMPGTSAADAPATDGGSTTASPADTATESPEEPSTTDDPEPAPDASGEDSAAEDEWYCSRCGYGPSTKRGIGIHGGHKHDDEVTAVASPQDSTPDELEPAVERVLLPPDPPTGSDGKPVPPKFIPQASDLRRHIASRVPGADLSRYDENDGYNSSALRGEELRAVTEEIARIHPEGMLLKVQGFSTRQGVANYLHNLLDVSDDSSSGEWGNLNRDVLKVLYRVLVLEEPLQPAIEAEIRDDPIVCEQCGETFDTEASRSGHWTSGETSCSSPDSEQSEDKDPRDYGSHLDVETLVDGMVGATSIYQVQRELRISRERARSLLKTLQLHDDLKHGSAPIEREEARAAVQAAIGGGENA